MTDYLRDNMKGLELLDLEPEFNLGQLMPNVVIEISNQKIHKFAIKETKSININENSRDLTVELIQVDLEYHFKYNMFSKPDWLRDQGTGKLNIKGLNITMKMTPYQDNGKLQINFTSDSNVPIAMETYDLDLNGTTDFSVGLSYLIDNFKDFFKNEISYLLSTGVSKSVD